MAELDLSQINVIAELDQMGWAWQPAGGDGAEIRCKCPNPQHEDANPSCQMNVEKKMFKCMVPTCQARGDFISFMALALNQGRGVVMALLAKRYDLDQTKSIDGEALERWHQAIWSCEPMLLELRKRGVTEQIIRKRRLGFDRGRITIPIYNEHGSCVNVRRYMPGAPGPEKMKNTRGHGSIRLYMPEQLKHDTIIVTGGEVKAMVTAEHMNRHGIGVVTATAGEGNWEPEFSAALRGKRVYVAMDIDREGRDAADLVAARIKGDARWVGNLLIPLDVALNPKGDLNDFFGQGHTDAELLEAMNHTEEWVPPKRETDLPEGDATQLHLSNVTEAVNTGRKVAVCGVVTQKDESPYLVPKRVTCECSRNAEFCAICPVFAETPTDGKFVELTVNPQHPALLQMIAAPRKGLRDAVREGLGIPPCKSVQFHNREYYNVEDVRLTPQLEVGSRSHDSVLRPAFFVGHGLDSNVAYRFEGRVYPHPKDQHAVLIASAAEPVEDTLDSYAPTDLELEELRVFQPTEWTVKGIREKLDDLYSDLEANVTTIYQRRDLHFVIDLIYHTVLLFDFDKREVKGWGEAVICGDSSQGKSDTSIRMMQHYGLGERTECKNATVPGLLGGLEKSGDRWFIKWGVIPTHDKRLVFLEELKGTSTEVIGKLTDMRSSGVAEVTKIEKRRTHARTRLVVISNPRSDRTLASYNFGCEAVKELIGNLEDVRRFDIAYLVSSSQVDSKELNILMQSRPKVRHRHTAELCRRCVLWAWTREPEQVIFTDEATQCIMTWSVKLSTTYSDALPLVDRGSIRLKLARLSIALACRTFSCANQDAGKVVVRECHVEFVAQFIDDTYGSTVFGYRDFSQALIAAEALLDPGIVRRYVLQVPYPSDFVESMLHTNEIEMRDIADWCGWEHEETRKLLSMFVRKHALVRERNHYRKSPSFIEFLKALQAENVLKKVERPAWMKEDAERDM